MDHTPQEIAQLKLRMHEATILQRDGQASHYITPVAHAVVTELTSTLGKRQHPVDNAHCWDHMVPPHNRIAHEDAGQEVATIDDSHDEDEFGGSVPT